ncbi:MAG: Calx-beta domain-containing protein [Rubripirellula sp.]|nr:Calx-beta domain-containing protein [Rubripirellula sp.]
MSAGSNLETGASCGLTDPTDIINTDPLLGPLQDNGGFVLTHGLIPGSPAIDAAGGSIAVDARGLPRPVDGNGDSLVIADIGAFEAGSALPLALVVDENSDVVDGNFSVGHLSLREAIERTNSNPGPDTITFGGIFADATPDTITLGGSQLEVTDDLDLIGTDASLLTISGNKASRIFRMLAGAQVSLSDVTLTGGLVTGESGGAILNNADLTIINSLITKNTASNLIFEAHGGGIENLATLTLSRTTVSDNVAGQTGGGIGNEGTLVLSESIVTGNSAPTDGGGIDNVGSLVLSESSVSGNSANYGGGIYNGGSVVMSQSSVSGNSAEFGGGIANLDGSLEVADSTIVSNNAVNNGGGIYNGGGTAVHASTISGNTAGGGGGVFSYESGSLTVSDSTISGNRAAVDGGGIAAQNGQFEVLNSTVSNNVADRNGGGLLIGQGPSNAVIIQSSIIGNRGDADGVGGGSGGGIQTEVGPDSPLRLFNTLVAGNVVGVSGAETASDLAGQPVNTISVHNLIADVATSGGLIDGVNGNLVGDGADSSLLLSDVVDPVLADNGGPTQTHALTLGSRALDAGDDDLATSGGDDGIPGTGDANETALTNDQRGDGFSRFLRSSVDIGAVESDQAKLLVQDVFVDEAAGVATVLVSLDAEVGTSFTVDFATSDDSAVAGDVGNPGREDYQPTSGQLSFSGLMDDVQTITIPINDDEVVEASEQFTIGFSNVFPGSLLLDIGDTGIVSIFDNDLATISTNDVSGFEADGFIDFTLTLEGQTQDPFDVFLQAASDFDAVPGFDYEAIFESVSFEGFDGETQTVSVEVFDDDVTELDEQLVISAEVDDASNRGIRFEGFGSIQNSNSVGLFATSGFDGNAIELLTPDSMTTIAFVGDSSGLRILDYSNPEAVVELGAFSIAGGVVEIAPTDITMYDGLLYVAARESGLVILDVTDPASISQVGSFSVLNQQAISLFRDGNTVYLGEQHEFNLTDGAVRILDVSDVGDIQELGVFNPGIVAVQDVVVDGSTAYIAVPDIPGGLQIVDVANPSTPTLLGKFELREALTVVVEGTTVYLGCDDGLSVLDVGDPTNIVERDFFPTVGPILEIVSEDSILTVGDLSGAFSFFDISTPTSVSDLGRISVVSSGVLDFVNEGLIYYVANTVGGVSAFEVIPISDSSATILDDDSSLLTIDSVTQPEDDGPMTFTVTLSGAVDTSVSVDIATADIVGQAEAGIDYTANSDTLVFDGNDGETQVFSVAVAADTDVEPDETFAVNLSNLFADLRNVSIVAPGQAIGTIQNDDFTSEADLSITQTASVDPVQPGAALTYTFLVTNNGPDAATNVSVSDGLPSGVAFEIGDVDGDESAVTIDQNEVTASIGDLGVGASATITIQTTVAENAAGDLVNTASVSGDEQDQIATNNSATETITVTVVINDDEVVVDEDAAAFEIDVLSNDLPSGGLTVTDVSSAGLGSAVITAGGGSITYTPSANRFGDDVFSYTAVNDFGQSGTAEITVTLTLVNDPPVVTDDSVDAIDRLDPLNIAASTLLVNDSPGPSEDSVQVVRVTEVDEFSAAGGVVTLDNDVITYFPPTGFNGLTDSFGYRVSDDGVPSLSSTGLVTINLPPPPATLQGHIHCDVNGDESESMGEAVVGSKVFLDTNGNRIHDAGELSTLTDANGDYVFTNILDPTLTVVAEVPDGCLSVPNNPGITINQIGINDFAQSLAATDFDGDGDKDLIVVGDLINNQATLLENEGGSFTLFGEVPLGDRPRSITAYEDLNGENQVTAVAGVGTQDDGGSLFMMAEGQVTSQMEIGNGPIDVAIADFDKNGVPDVVVATLRSSDIRLVLNNEVQSEPLADTRHAIAVEAGDVNGDGNADIVFGGHGYGEEELSPLTVRLGDGLGGFEEPLAVVVAPQLVDLKVAPLDSISDASADRFVWSLSEPGVLSLHDVSGSSMNLVSTTSVMPKATSMDVGDFNRDGRMDVAIASVGEQMIELYIGNGGGRFALVTTIDLVSAPSDLVVADFDQDGSDDLAVSNLAQDLNLGQGESAPTLPTSVTVLLLDVAQSALVVSDGVIGRVDFAFQNADPGIQFDVTGEGVVSALDALRVVNALQDSTPQQSTGEGEQINQRQATDVNGDGRTSALDALMIVNYLARQSTAIEAALDLFNDDDEEDERIAALDVIFGQLV